MIIRDLFFESGSTEATKIKKILQRYVIYIYDQITVPYLNTETGNRRLNIVDGMFSLEERGTVQQLPFFKTVRLYTVVLNSFKDKCNDVVLALP
jgi:hypothetical protein